MLDRAATLLQQDLLAPGVLETFLDRAVVTPKFGRLHGGIAPTSGCAVRDRQVEARRVACEEEGDVEEAGGRVGGVWW